MKTINFLALLVLLAFATAHAQETDPNIRRVYRNFPLVIGLQFQAIGLPFKNFKESFANPGIRIGTEVSLTGRQAQNWAQGFNFGWNYNKNAGNNIQVFTQTIYRPTIVSNFNTDVRIGIGMMRSLHPTDSFKQINGEWVNQGTAGKTMLMVPAGISVGYNGYSSSGTYVSPFINYEIMAAANYNRIVPVLPVSSFQVGTRIYLVNLKERK